MLPSGGLAGEPSRRRRCRPAHPERRRHGPAVRAAVSGLHDRDCRPQLVADASAAGESHLAPQPARARPLGRHAARGRLGVGSLHVRAPGRLRGGRRTRRGLLSLLGGRRLLPSAEACRLADHVRADGRGYARRRAQQPARADASLEAFHDSAFRLFRKHAGSAAQLLAPLVYAGLRMRLAFMKRLVRSRRS